MSETNINTKGCNKCHELKSLTEFSKDKKTKNGLNNWCKSCVNICNNAYSHTKLGIVSRIYSGQRKRSKLKGYSMPNYTKAELFNWLNKQINFDCLYLNWINSGYSKMKVPSCDRLDDYKPYTLSNIQLMTWAENKKKGETDKKAGRNNKQSKRINQMSLDGEFIKSYYSAHQAARTTGFHNTNISACCLGKLKAAYGFKWEFNTGESRC